ncbi:hypothetical protein ABIB68_005360 [Bradyrhizobium sp. F1.2.2]
MIRRKPLKPEYATWVAIQKRGPICQFFTLTQTFDGPLRYGASARFKRTLSN